MFISFNLASPVWDLWYLNWSLNITWNCIPHKQTYTGIECTKISLEYLLLLEIRAQQLSSGIFPFTFKFLGTVKTKACFVFYFHIHSANKCLWSTACGLWVSFYRNRSETVLPEAMLTKGSWGPLPVEGEEELGSSGAAAQAQPARGDWWGRHGLRWAGSQRARPRAPVSHSHRAPWGPPGPWTVWCICYGSSANVRLEQKCISLLHTSPYGIHPCAIGLGFFHLASVPSTRSLPAALWSQVHCCTGRF